MFLRKSIHVSFLTWKMTFSRLLGDLSNKPRTVPGCGWIIGVISSHCYHMLGRSICWKHALHSLHLRHVLVCVCLSGFEGDFIEGKLKAKACYCQRQANALWSYHALECFKNVSDIYLSFCGGGGVLSSKQPGIQSTLHL